MIARPGDLAGFFRVVRRVELRYDPENLAVIEVFLDGRPAGAAVPFVIGRHVHRAVAPAPPPAAEATGIDYLGMVAAAHDEQAGAGAPIDFTQLKRLPAAQDGQDGDG